MNRLEISARLRSARGLSTVFGGLFLLLAIGCSSDSATPTAPTRSDLFMTSANILVNGQSVNGLTVARGQGGSTRFEAQLLTRPDSTPTSPPMMWLEFGRPQGMGMARDTGRVQLFDDGTHGDQVTGDGLYCFEDIAGDYGMHTASAPMGEYHYEFYGIHDSHETNHINVTVTVIDS